MSWINGIKYFFIVRLEQQIIRQKRNSDKKIDITKFISSDNKYLVSLDATKDNKLIIKNGHKTFMEKTYE